MTVDLSTVVFENSFYSVSMNNGYTINMNRVNEDFLDSQGNSVVIKRINIEILDEEGLYLRTSTSIIGLEDECYSLVTDHKEYEGDVLDEDNMKYVLLEVKDE